MVSVLVAVRLVSSETEPTEIPPITDGSSVPLMVIVTTWLEPSLAQEGIGVCQCLSDTERLNCRQGVVQRIGPGIAGILSKSP